MLQTYFYLIYINFPMRKVNIPSFMQKFELSVILAP